MQVVLVCGRVGCGRTREGRVEQRWEEGHVKVCKQSAASPLSPQPTPTRHITGQYSGPSTKSATHVPDRCVHPRRVGG